VVSRALDGAQACTERSRSDKAQPDGSGTDQPLVQHLAGELRRRIGCFQIGQPLLLAGATEDRTAVAPGPVALAATLFGRTIGLGSAEAALAAGPGFALRLCPKGLPAAAVGAALLAVGRLGCLAGVWGVRRAGAGWGPAGGGFRDKGQGDGETRSKADPPGAAGG